ncbi:hypothetical protein [Terrimonas ferruginea]|uniref:hypothetical protein n=1 Tax=Terrimonas ferruginea TaxID=249 RepID=UPI00040778AD|nr:hypothetical protein [Terrimonas ferruginea]
MKEYTIVFQIGNVDYLTGNCFYTATIKEFPPEDDTIRYWVHLHDEVLVRLYGRHHDYYYKAGNKVNFTMGDGQIIMDLHRPVMLAIEKIRTRQEASAAS